MARGVRSGGPRVLGNDARAWEIDETEGGAGVGVTCDDIPSGISIEDNRAGTASSLENLADLVDPG